MNGRLLDNSGIVGSQFGQNKLKLLGGLCNILPILDILSTWLEIYIFIEYVDKEGSIVLNEFLKLVEICFRSKVDSQRDSDYFQFCKVFCELFCQIPHNFVTVDTIGILAQIRFLIVDKKLSQEVLEYIKNNFA